MNYYNLTTLGKVSTDMNTSLNRSEHGAAGFFLLLEMFDKNRPLCPLSHEDHGMTKGSKPSQVYSGRLVLFYGAYPKENVLRIAA